MTVAFRQDIDWNEVKERLEKRNMSMYYVGGTLSISLDSKRFVALNLDGEGFDQDDNILQQPEFIKKIVRDIYVETKGETQYYKDEILKI